VARTATQATDVGNGIEQRYQLGDVVPVAAGQRHRERSAPPVDDHMVLAAGTAATQSPISSRPAIRSSALAR
jgi:hypothetical protein